MFCYQIKLIVDNKGIKNNSKIIESIKNVLSGIEYKEIKVKSVSDDLKKLILETFQDKVHIRDGAMNGCYGSTTGEVYKGLTLTFHASEVTDRCLDEDNNEYANIYYTILESGGTLIEDLDGDKLEDALDLLGLEAKRDNSYNWSGNTDVEFIFDFDFAVFEHEGKALLSIKFHCGGDPRGNYTDKYVYAFDSIDDLYSAIMPCVMLKDEA